MLRRALATALLTLLVAAPAWALRVRGPTVDGTTFDLASHRQPAIVEFFATWCRPCRASLRHMERVWRAYKGRVVVVGYSIDREGLRVVRPLVARLGITFPVVVGSLGEAKALVGLRRLPTTVVLGPDGRVLGRFEGRVSTQKILELLRPWLGEAAPPPTPAPPGQHQRIQAVWVTPAALMMGRRGWMVHVLADVADMNPYQGLWLELVLTPVRRQGRECSPAGPARRLYQRIDEVWRRHFIMFVTCSQTPNLPPGAVFKLQVNLLAGARHRQVATGPGLWAANPCASGELVQGPEWSGGVHLVAAWVVPGEYHNGRPGWVVHVRTRLKGLATPLWLGVEVAGPGGGRKLLVRRITDTSRERFALFVGCDQLPEGWCKGPAKVWVVLISAKGRREIERSGQMVVGGSNEQEPEG